MVLAIIGGEVAEEITDGDDKLKELIEDESHENLAAPGDVILLELLPDTVGTVQVDHEVDTDEDVGGGHGGHGADHRGDEEDVELTDEVGGHQVHRGNSLARCLPSYGERRGNCLCFCCATIDWQIKLQPSEMELCKP